MRRRGLFLSFILNENIAHYSLYQCLFVDTSPSSFISLAEGDRPVYSSTRRVNSLFEINKWMNEWSVPYCSTYSRHCTSLFTLTLFVFLYPSSLLVCLRLISWWMTVSWPDLVILNPDLISFSSFTWRKDDDEDEDDHTDHQKTVKTKQNNPSSSTCRHHKRLTISTMTTTMTINHRNLIQWSNISVVMTVMIPDNVQLRNHRRTISVRCLPPSDIQYAI